MNKNISKLMEKYKGQDVSGNTYEKLVKQILKEQSKEISNKVLHLNKRYWDNINLQNKKLLTLPPLSKMDTTRTVIALKSAENGKLITQTLREKLQNDIKSTIEEYKMNKLGLYQKRGVKSGALRPEVVNDIENKMRMTFEGYTKVNRKIGMPNNIHNIAVTETRGTVNRIKYEYSKEVIKSNRNYVFSKTWIHNRMLSKKARIPHKKLNGKTIPFNEFFIIDSNDNKYKCLHPHDDSLPASEIISCNCDIKINIKKKL
jgi:hypothetical protein